MIHERLHRGLRFGALVGVVCAIAACERPSPERSAAVPSNDRTVATVVAPPAERTASQTPPRPTIKRDPFKLGATGARVRVPVPSSDRARPAAKAPVRSRARPDVEPSVTVQGVMVWADRRVALIDGKTHRVGDRITASGVEWVIDSIDAEQCVVTFRRGEGEGAVTATLGPNLGDVP